MFGGGFFKHPVQDLGFDAWVSDAHPQSPVLIASELGVDVSQSVVSSMSSTKFELGLSRHDVKLIVNHQDLFGFDFEKLCQLSHRLARCVHERLGLKEPNGLAFVHGLAHQTLVAFFKLQVHLELVRELIDPPKARVVAGLFVFGARVAQAYKKFNHGVGDFKRLWRVSPETKNGPEGPFRT